MLQAIRERTQGWIAGTIIAIIILTFALWGIHSYFTGNANNTNVASVNGSNIAKEQLASAYERMRRQAQAQPGNINLDVKEDAEIRHRALQALIDIEITKQASIKEGFVISNNQIDNYLQNMPDFQVNGQFSWERLQEVLASSMLSTSDFLELIKTTLLIEQPRLGIVLTSFALPDETAYTISLVNQERDLAYISIPEQYFLSQPMTISADKIKAYYDQHQAEFMTPDQVNVDYVQLSLPALSATLNPTDADLKSFYGENVSAYSQPMAWKLSPIFIPVSADATPDQFSKAQALADTIALAVKGNDKEYDKFATEYADKNMGKDTFITLSQLPPELQKPVSALTEVNQTSSPIKFSRGYVILKALAIQEPKIQPFDAVKDKVKATYVRQRAEEKFSEVRDQLANMTYEHPDTLQYAVKNLNLPMGTSGFFTKDKAGNDISQNKKVRDTAFSNDVLNLQNNSDVIQINPETVIVLRVKSHTPPALLPLKTVSDQIENKLKDKEAEKLASAFVKEMQAKLQAGANSQQLADSYHFTWNQVGYTGRYNTKVDSAILDVAFGLPHPVSANKVAYSSTRLPTGYAIIAVKAVKPGVITDPKQQAVFAEQVQTSEGLLEYELYKKSLTDKSTVKIAE